MTKARETTPLSTVTATGDIKWRTVAGGLVGGFFGLVLVTEGIDSAVRLSLSYSWRVITPPLLFYLKMPEDPFDRAIGERIREYRLDRGIPAREVAKAAYMSPCHLCHLETGRRTWTAKQVQRVGEALGVKDYRTFLPPPTKRI
jgi:hypothetical protein